MNQIDNAEPMETRSNYLTDEQRELATRYFNMIYTFVDEKHISYEEYTPILSVTLCEAAMSYKPDKNISFSTFAWKCMENAVINEIKKERADKRIPREKIDSLNRELQNDDGETVEYGEFIKSKDNPESTVVAAIHFSDCLNKLTKREQLIIKLFVQQNSLDEIAEMLNCSKQYISQVTTKFRKMFKETSCF